MNRLPNTPQRRTRNPEDQSPTRARDPITAQASSEASSDLGYLAQGARPRTSRRTTPHSPSSTSISLQERKIAPSSRRPLFAIDITSLSIYRLSYMVSLAPHERKLSEQSARVLKQLQQLANFYSKEQAREYKKVVRAHHLRLQCEYKANNATNLDRKKMKKVLTQLHIAQLEEHEVKEQYRNSTVIFNQASITLEKKRRSLCAQLLQEGVLSPEIYRPLLNCTSELTPEDLLPSYNTVIAGIKAVPDAEQNANQLSPPPYTEEDAIRGFAIREAYIDLPPPYTEREQQQ